MDSLNRDAESDKRLVGVEEPEWKSRFEKGGFAEHLVKHLDYIVILDFRSGHNSFPLQNVADNCA